jgi:hypothetical protein
MGRSGVILIFISRNGGIEVETGRRRYKYSAPPNQVRQPRPNKSPRSIRNRDDADHLRSELLGLASWQYHHSWMNKLGSRAAAQRAPTRLIFAVCIALFVGMTPASVAQENAQQESPGITLYLPMMTGGLRLTCPTSSRKQTLVRAHFNSCDGIELAETLSRC